MYIYFIRSGVRGPIKIGIAKNVDKRLSDLQCANPYELSLITKVKCDSRRHALYLEKRLHKMFSHKHLRGEWFNGNIQLKKADEFLSLNHIQKDKDKKEINERLDMEALLSSPI